MTLSALISKGGLTAAMTATHATVATHETDKPPTVAAVAAVATVTVTTKPEPLTELTFNEVSSIRVWLAYIGECDSVIIAEVLDKSRDNLAVRKYLLNRSKEVPKPYVASNQITCGDCRQFKRIEHPHLGHCIKGEPEAPVGHWDNDSRCCKRWLPINRHKGD